MRSLKLLILFVFLVSSLFLVINSSADNSLRNAVIMPADDSDDSVQSPGQELFIRNCARCHGADGQGDTNLGRSLDTPDLTDAERQKKWSKSKLERLIQKGRGPMPAFGKKLKKKEISVLITYVQTFKK
jgi:mono/diheme cytochrome c family protein